MNAVTLTAGQMKLFTLVTVLGKVPCSVPTKYIESLGGMLHKTDSGYKVHQDILNFLAVNFPPMTRIMELKGKGFVPDTKREQPCGDSELGEDSTIAGIRMIHPSKCDRIVWWNGQVTAVFQTFMLRADMPKLEEFDEEYCESVSPMNDELPEFQSIMAA